MSTSNGEIADQNTFNNSYMSREVDTSAVGKIDLNNSGSAFVVDAQNRINVMLTDIASNLASIGVNASNIATNVSSIAANLVLISNLQSLSGVSGATDNGAFTGSTFTDNLDTKAILQEAETAIEARQLLSEKGVANGYASLDGSGQVPLSQMNNAVMTFLGAWNPTTNTPTLADGVGTNGDTYRATTADTIDLGSGNITFAIDDRIQYNGTIWLKWDASDPANTDEIVEGSTNLYYTEGRVSANTSVAANTAKVSASGSIDTHSDVDITTVAPTDKQALVWNAGNSEFEPQDQTGGGGSGGINYIEDGEFELGVSGWGQYFDGASATPVDGLGVGTIGTITHETTAQFLIRGTGTLVLTKNNVNNKLGSGMKTPDFTIDKADINKSLNVLFDYSLDTRELLGIYKLFVYDIDNSTLLGPLINDDDADLSPVGYEHTPSQTVESSIKFAGRFYTTDSLNYRILFHRTTGATTSVSRLAIDNFRVSPDVLVPGAIVEEWKEYTPTGSWVSNSTYSGRWRRIGDSMEIDAHINLTGIPTAAQCTISIPSGHTIDVNKLSFITALRPALGTAMLTDSGTRLWSGIAVYNTSTTIGIAHTESGNFGQVNATNPFAWNANDDVSIRVTVPIVGWSAGALQSTTETLFSTDKVRYKTSVAGSYASGATTILDYGTKDYDDLNSVTTGASWKYTSPRSAKYRITARALMTTTTAWATNESFELHLYINGSVAAFLGRSTGDDTSVNAGFLVSQGVTTVELNKGDTVDIRLTQNSGVTLSLNADALQNYMTIEELPDFSAFSIFGETDLIESTAGFSAYAVGANVTNHLTSIELGPGEWDLFATTQSIHNGAGTASRIQTGILPVPGTDITGQAFGDNYALGYTSALAGTSHTLPVKVTVSLSVKTIYYLKYNYEQANTNLQVAYKISARKIK